jgi:hypothetical protein
MEQQAKVAALVWIQLMPTPVAVCAHDHALPTLTVDVYFLRVKWPFVCDLSRVFIRPERADYPPFLEFSLN